MKDSNSSSMPDSQISKLRLCEAEALSAMLRLLKLLRSLQDFRQESLSPDQPEDLTQTQLLLDLPFPPSEHQVSSTML